MIFNTIIKGSGTEINNQDKTITKNGSYTADEGYTGLGTVTVNVHSEGDVVEAIALGTAKEAAVNDKVLLNKAVDYNGVTETTGSEYSNSSYYQLSGNNLYGGFINGQILGNLWLSNGNTAETLRYYNGQLSGRTVVFSQSGSGSLGAVRLPPLQQNQIGFGRDTLYKLNVDGSRSSIVSFSDYIKVAFDFYDDSLFCFKRNNGSYVSWRAVFPSGDTSYVYKEIPDIYYFSNAVICKIGGVHYVISTDERGGAYKVTPEAGWEKVADTTSNNVGGYGASRGFPLDETGNHFILTQGYNYIVDVCKLNRLETSWTFSRVASESNKISQAKGSIIVLPIRENVPVADIFLMSFDNNLEHYQWDGVEITKLANIFNSADMGEYTNACDFLVDGNAGVLWAVYSNGTGKGSKMKIFVAGLGSVINKEFAASSYLTRNWSDGTLTGFVKSNEGQDEFGNTILKINTVTDPNVGPWSDVGKVFGFNVKVEAGSL